MIPGTGAEVITMVPSEELVGDGLGLRVRATDTSAGTRPADAPGFIAAQFFDASAAMGPF